MANETGAILDITSFNTHIGSITGGGGAGGNVTLGAATLTVGGDNTSPVAAYAGVISGDGGALTKIGTGTQTLSGQNSYTGLTTVSAGTLAYGANNVLSTGAVTVDGATAVLALGAFIDSVGTVTVANGGSITGRRDSDEYGHL